MSPKTFKYFSGGMAVLVLFGILLSVPGVLLAESGVTLTRSSIIKAFENIRDWLASIAVALGVISMLWGAVMFLTAAGDPQKITSAKSHIVWGLVGVAIAILAYGVFEMMKSFLE